LVLYVTGVLARWHPLTISGSIIMALAVGSHIRLMLEYFRNRKSGLDASLGTILLAVTNYGVALILGVVLLGTGISGGRIWAAYALFAIVGWLCMMALGVMLRVVPRVATLLAAEHGTRPGGGDTAWSPRRWQWSSVVPLAAGLLGVGGGVLLGHTAMARSSAVLFALGALLATPPVLRSIRLGVATTLGGGDTPGK
jgi:hypothetical protein